VNEVLDLFGDLSGILLSRRVGWCSSYRFQLRRFRLNWRWNDRVVGFVVSFTRTVDLQIVFGVFL
jgi:hypothetical protein